ncbi:DEAD/DEAH box helicase [Metallosphaera javensis (ex Sakai et al. 2022)]|uniref:DEAD/DEAH box helicase n=1 Tax=Metallosphaera javensis (ex Sakai et al. 2022) TaxID=2775498 RepID=UPI00258B9C67|nr:MAG: hypothetical protein MjAS7_2906 [Metallosphaera javensis (ex Sakai et al. 2022)]
MIKMEIFLENTFLEEGQTEINRIKLRKFQEDLYKIIRKKGETDKIIIKAPTGSGKTFSLLILLIDALDNKLPVVGMYPSRVLVYDQGKSVLNTLKNMNFKISEGNNFYEVKGEFEIKNNEEVERKTAEFYLAMLTSKTKDEVFAKVNELWGKNLLILTVPEYPYLFLTKLGLSNVISQIFEATTKYSTREAIDKLNIPKQPISRISNLFARIFNGYWFIDEFHLYSGISRSSLNALIKAFDFWNERNPIKKPIIFSSATPTNIQGYSLEVKTSKEGSKIKKETKIVFHLVSGNPQEELVNNIPQKIENQTGIILDRVYYISQLCQKNWEEKPALVWGLDKDYGNCVKTDKIENQKIIIGNQALSFGIDVPNLDKGYIFAHDAETLIQRFGRFGRKGEGSAEVHIFLEGKYKTIKTLNEYKEKKKDYETFLDLIRKIYDKRVDDKLDQLTFSKEREKAILSAVEIIYAIEQGKDFVRSVIQDMPKSNIRIRPSTEDYFRLFSLRPGGIEGKICNSDYDEFFTLLRNFEYNLNDQCFNLEKPIKESPYIKISAYEVRTCELITIERFYNYKPILVFRNQKQQIYLRQLKELEGSYVILIKKSCFENPGEWEDQRRMAELVATYESALPVYADKENFIALALFI